MTLILAFFIGFSKNIVKETGLYFRIPETRVFEILRLLILYVFNVIKFYNKYSNNLKIIYKTSKVIK